MVVSGEAPENNPGSDMAGTACGEGESRMEPSCLTWFRIKMTWALTVLHSRGLWTSGPVGESVAQRKGR